MAADVPACEEEVSGQEEVRDLGTHKVSISVVETRHPKLIPLPLDL